MLFITSDDEIKLNKGLHCLYFYSSSVCVHKQIVSIIKSFEQNNSKILFKAIDIDHFDKISMRFKIKSLPTIIFYDTGKQTKTIEGLLIPTALKAILTDIAT